MIIRIAIAVALIILCSAVSLNWYFAVSELKERVETNVQNLSANLTARNPRMKFTYEEVNLAGYPLNTAVLLKKPKVSLDELTEILELSTEEIYIQKMKMDDAKWNIVLPNEWVATKLRAGQLKTYNITMSKMPGMQTSMSQENGVKTLDGLVKRFALIMPKDMMLSFTLGEMKREIIFSFAIHSLAIWQTPTYIYSGPYSFFFDILAEAETHENLAPKKVP